MKIEIAISIYEVNGEKHYGKELKVQSHRNYDDFVVLIFEDKNITVNAKVLKEAIQRTTGWR